MTKPSVPGEGDWLRDLVREDDLGTQVVSHNYGFERDNDILDLAMRTDFVESMLELHRRPRRPGPRSAGDRYWDTILSDSRFWTLGQTVTPKAPLAMVRCYDTIYREQWTIFSGLPENPDIETAMAALGSPVNDRDEQRRLRRGAEIRRQLFRTDVWRQRINQDLTGMGWTTLTPEDAYTWDSYESHRRYHDDMTAEGYIPIWWVTESGALAREFAEAGSPSPTARAEIAANALGLSGARPGPYYVCTLPPRRDPRRAQADDTFGRAGGQFLCGQNKD